MGFVLLVSGWALVLAALVLLAGLSQRFAFVLAGIAVEGLGIFMLANEYKALHTVKKPSGARR